MAQSSTTGSSVPAQASKYHDLHVPLECEWTSSDGSRCGTCFSNVPALSSHVKEHYKRLYIYTESRPQICCWSGCDFVANESDTVIQHILFHPFHSYLKLLGAELKAKFQLPNCQIDEQYKNLVPPLQIALKCQWDNGNCVAEFEGTGDFFIHVREHVMTIDTQCCCKWKGIYIHKVIHKYIDIKICEFM